MLTYLHAHSFKLHATIIPGPLNIAVHEKWAPIGAERFLKLVEIKWFSSQIAMFRAVKNFLVQVSGSFVN